MKIQWSNKAQTYVTVEVMGSAHQIPASDNHPDWQRMKAMVEAGNLVIAPYEPPTPPAPPPDIQG